ncbi:50S ribosomal protein L22 [Patescibacteria group bacterium]|nr:MAG: 50S ribosomal protein L22 [Patescibacteria group bacterium]
MKVTASLKNLRISPRKVRLVADFLKGMDTQAALVQLRSFVKRSNDPLEKLLKSAIANAENNFGLDHGNLYVYEIQVGAGSVLKRWMPRAFGRATPIAKRSSHVYLTLEERVEGKNRKSKEQLEKERKERAEAKQKLEKELTEAREKAMAEQEQKVTEGKGEEVVKVKGEKLGSERDAKRGQKGSWMKKVFQRKAM